MDHQQTHSFSANSSLLAGVAGVAKNMFCLLVNRIELAALEISEVSTHLAKLLLFFVCGIIALWFAVAYGTALIVFLMWEIWGWKTRLLMAVGFFCLAFGLFVYVPSMLKQNKFSLS